ncbi:MAG: PorT family protein [Bacteroidetes bacterium]|nr:PorT family protein [Bacteroidota bacterium]
MRTATTIFVIAVLLLTVRAGAQSLTAGMRVGAALGSPIPIGHIPEGSSGLPVPGFVGGAWLRNSLSERWGLALELVYTKYSSTFSAPLVDQPYIDRVVVTGADGSQSILEVETIFNGLSTGQFSNSYLQIPCMVHWTAASDLSVVGGPYVGYLVSTGTYATGVGTVGIRPEVVQKDMTFTEKMQKWDVGLQAGVQWSLWRDVFVDGRCTYGLTSVFDPSFRTIQYPVQNLFMSFCVGVVLL